MEIRGEVKSEAMGRARIQARSQVRILAGIPILFVVVAGLIAIFGASTRLYTDQAGYFAWSYALLVDGSLDPGPALGKWSPENFPEQMIHGRVMRADKFPIGWSLATLPFTAAGRAVGALMGYEPTDERMLALLVRAGRLGVLFWVVVGLGCAYGAIARLTSPLSAAGAIFLVWLGTSAFAYTWREPGMSHGVSLAFIAIAYYAGVRSMESARAMRWAVLLGIAAGVVVCCRSVNLVLVLPAFGLLMFRFAEGGGRKFVFEKRRVAGLGVAVAAMLPLLGMQAGIWKYVYGEWFFNGYSERFLFEPGTLMRVLFSSRHGLIFWHPIVVVCLAGLAVGILRSEGLLGRRMWIGSVVIAITVLVLIYGSWPVWSLGWSFGARWAADAFFLWALGLSLFGERFMRGGNIKVFAMLLLLSVVSCALIVGQFSNLLPRDDYLTFPLGGK